MKIQIVIAALSTLALGFGEMNCGIRPIPEIGCRIGKCVSGSWKQICN